MNTVKSFWYGWGALIVAGGGAYYFAKKDIDAERRRKHMELQRKQREQNMMYENEFNSRSPAAEASSDPAPTRHEPQTEDQQVREKSKYEASEVFRSPKGDRFS
ncbi:hypothetical protein BDD12DRAFT_880902 [Trichophaea hybrida]|nr:hypothetical protein BDD12DRAFT_880902 [Trichophaea hybrida]